MFKLLPPSQNAIQIHAGTPEAISLTQTREKLVDNICYRRFTVLVETPTKTLVSDWWIPAEEWDTRKHSWKDLIYEEQSDD